MHRKRLVVLLEWKRTRRPKEEGRFPVSGFAFGLRDLSVPLLG
jgi:hypothetical protein